MIYRNRLHPPVLSRFARGAAVLAVVLCASGSLVSAEEMATGQQVYGITIHDLPFPDSVEYAPFQEILKYHPRIRYKRHTQLRIQGLERGSLLMTIAGGTAPDILRVYHHEAKAWIRQGFFAPLDKYIYKDTDGDGRYTHGKDEVIWKPFLNLSEELRDMVTEDGHIYILPRFQWIQFLIYRKDLFREAGVDPEKRIETFEELRQVCMKLTDPNARITGAKHARGRQGIGIYPNGWIWQGWLYAYGGGSVKYLRKCPECGTENEFHQREKKWLCSHCGHYLKYVPGRERADFNSPAGLKALKLWQDLLWAPFTKCPGCGEPISLGDTHAHLEFPVKRVCPFCKAHLELKDKSPVVQGCARPLIDDDSDWQRLLLNGEIAIIPYYDPTRLADSNIDPRIIGMMPFPEKGGASAYHYYGVYAGAKDRKGGQDRVDVCASFVLDYVRQFYVAKDDADYLKYDRRRIARLVDNGFYNLCSYDELVAAGLVDYAKEVPAGSREMQRLIRDPAHYELLPTSEGYSRVQQEVLGRVLVSGICNSPDYDVLSKLKEAEELANTQVFMKDEIVEELMDRYRMPFFAGMAGLALFVAFLVSRILMKKGEDESPPPLVAKLSFGKRVAAVLLLFPAAVTISVWAYYPLVRGSIMAFQNVKVLGSSRFVDIENFVRVLSNPQFPNIILITFIYVFAVLSLGFFAPLILALMLSEIRRGTIFFRVLYYAPHLLSGAVVIFIWKVFYMPTPEGMLNELIAHLGFQPVRWLQNTSINKWALAVPGIWAGAGAASLVYLAALKGIDEEMYEAAEIDGAGTLDKVRHVTLPSLKPLLIINFVGAFIGAFHGMANVLILTGGSFETNVIGLQIFTESFAYLRFGISTALAWILGSFLISFTIVQLGILKKVEFRRAS